jgi:amino acid adenylation domain-containing protein
MPKLNSLKSELLQPVRGKQTDVKDDLIAVFLKNVASKPESIAIITTSTSLTYQQLYVEVTSWKALFSQQLHDRVVVCLERTPRVFSVLLALQWLEIAYIPVDPSLPIERLRRIIEDSQAQAILYDAPHHEHDYASLPCLQLDLANIERPVLSMQEATYTCSLKPESIVYIIYTSGSTGSPKGVAISRRALNNFLTSMSEYFLIEDRAFLLAITTIAFDMAALELYLPLWQQKTIFFANQEEHKDPLHINNILNNHPITLLQATPAMWKLLDDVGLTAKSNLVALSGGEPLTVALAQRLLSKVSELWNMYGPTEATVSCAIKQIKQDEPITIGRPINNMEMCVMDPSHRILPPDVKGELFVGGLGLAEGYVNDEAMTQSRFIPYADVLGGRLYAVGDIACATSDGEFIMFGRCDNQIKLHGYRIELEDIEAHIQTILGIRECAVIAFEEQLIAYLCPADVSQFSENALMSQLAVELPQYMVPNRIIYLEKLPLTSNGKVDRKALPRPCIATTKVRSDAAILTPTQSALLSIWTAELDHSSIGINDNFFELGGHSLIAVRIVAKISRQLEKQIDLKAFYQAPTILQLAEIIEKSNENQPVDFERKNALLKPGRRLPLNDFQLMLWISMVFEEPKLKNISVVDRRRVQGPLNKEALDLALKRVCQKQGIFSYAINRFYPSQKKQIKQVVKWTETSLPDCDPRTTESLLKASLDELYYNTSWLTSKVMIIAKLFYLNDGNIELQVGMSHLIADEESLEIFFQELSSAYLYYEKDSILEVDDSPHPIISYTVHQNEVFARYGEIDAIFWKHYLEDTSFFSFPEKYIIKNVENDLPSSSSYIEIDESILTKLRAFCSLHYVNVSDVLTAAVGMSLKMCCEPVTTSQHKLFINTVKSTRDDPHFDNVIGCFLRVHPIKLDISQHDITLANLSKQAQLSSLETTEHQRASSLVKLASIGHLPRSKKLVKRFLIPIVLALCSRILKRGHINTTLISACKVLSAVDRQKGFVINVNILNNFFLNSNQAGEKSLLGVPCQAVPMHSYHASVVQYVFDVCFLRDSHKNIPFVVVSSNLTPAFRQLFGKTLLRILQHELT